MALEFKVKNGLLIENISPLGSAATIFLVSDVNGVIKSRTASEILSDIGAVPTSRTLTINGFTQSLAADRTYTITTTGTADRITVTGGSGLTPTIDIASTYVGQTSITTLGTITTGVWNGTPIGSAYITEADTLATVTGRGATTSTAVTFNGGFTASTGTITAGNGDQLYLNNTGQRYTQLSFSNNGTTKGAIWLDNTDATFDIYGASGIGLRFYTSTLLRYTIDASGNNTWTGSGAFGGALSGTSGTFSGLLTGARGLYNDFTSGLPATSGSATRGGLRLANSSNIALDFGTVAAGQAWIQVSDVNNYASNFPLLLNPNGGNVGIGTTSPTEKLDVRGNIYTNATNTNLYLDNGGVGGAALKIGVTGTTSTYINSIDAHPIIFLTTNTDRGRITSAGRWLFGTATDDGSSIGQFAGDVKLTATSPSLFINRVNTSSNAAIQYQTAGSQDWFVGTGVSGTNSDYHVYSATLGADALTILKSTGAATFSSSVSATGINTGNLGLNVSGFGRWTQTVSGQMSILGHNIEAHPTTANATRVVNGGWISSMIRMYYNDGITFHTSPTFYSAGADYPIYATQRMGIDANGVITFNSYAGSGNRIAYVTSGGVLGTMVIGSGLSFDGTTLSATGGSSGTVTGSGTSGIIPLWNSASDIGNSVMTQSGSTITLSGNLYGLGYVQANRGTTNTVYTVGDFYGSSSMWSIRTNISNGFALDMYNGGIPINALTISSAGAATFSSSVTASSLIKSGGTSSQFLKADGSVDTNTYLTSAGAVTSITGTADQVIASASTGAVTLSLPQSIATTSNVTFNQVTATNGGFDSDITLKNILSRDISNMRILDKIKPALFTWKNPNKGTKPRVGYIAQEIQMYLPDTTHRTDSGTEALDYTQVFVVLINELYERIKYLESKI